MDESINLNITQEEYEQLKSQGVSDEQIAQQYSTQESPETEGNNTQAESSPELKEGIPVLEESSVKTIEAGVEKTQVNPVQELFGSVGQGLVDIPQEIGEFISRYIGTPIRNTLANATGHPEEGMPFKTKEEEDAFYNEGKLTVYKPKTNIGEGIELLTKYLVPALAGGLAANALKIPAYMKGIVFTTGQAVTDAALYDDRIEYGNLSALVNKAAPNPISEFLATYKDTPDLEARFKNSLEGVMIGETAQFIPNTVKTFVGLKQAIKDNSVKEFAMQNAAELQKVDKALRKSLKQSNIDNVVEHADNLFNINKDYNLADDFIKNQVPVEDRQEVWTKLIEKHNPKAKDVGKTINEAVSVSESQLKAVIKKGDLTKTKDFKDLVRNIKSPEQVDTAIKALADSYRDSEIKATGEVSSYTMSFDELKEQSEMLVKDLSDKHGVNANQMLLNMGMDTIEELRQSHHKLQALYDISSTCNNIFLEKAKSLRTNGYNANEAGEAFKYMNIYNNMNLVEKAGRAELGRGLRYVGLRQFISDVNPKTVVKAAVEKKLPDEIVLEAIGVETSAAFKNAIKGNKDISKEVLKTLNKYKEFSGLSQESLDNAGQFVKDTVESLRTAKTEKEVDEIISNNTQGLLQFKVMEKQLEQKNILGLFDNGKSLIKTSEEVVNSTFLNNVFSPITHYTNFFSNTIFGLTHSPAHILGGIRNQDPAETAKGIISGMTGFSNLFDSAVASLKTAITEEPILSPSVFSSMFKATDGERKFVKPLSAEHLGVNKIPVIAQGADLLGAIGRLNYRIGITIDELGKQYNYRNNAKAEVLWNTYLSEGLGDLGKFSQKAKESFDTYFDELGRATDKDLLGFAEEYSARGQKETIITDVGKSISGVSNKIPFVGKVLLPFVNTTSNLLQIGAEFTPVTILQKRFHEDMIAGGDRAAIAMGRLQLGTALMLTTSGLAMNGHLTGKLPSDPRQRQEAIEAGMKEYSFVYDTPIEECSPEELKTTAIRYGIKSIDKTEIVNGLREHNISQIKTYRSYLRIQPFGSIAGVITDLIDMSEHINDYKDQTAIGLEVFDTFMQAVSNTTYLRTLKEQLDFVTPSGRNLIEEVNPDGETKIGVNPNAPSGKYVGKLVPNLIPYSLQGTQRYFMNDNQLKETYGVFDRVKQTYPFKLMDDGVPIEPKRDFMTGQPLYNDSYYFGLMQTTRVANHPVYTEIRKLMQEGKGLTIPDVPMVYKEQNFVDYRDSNRRSLRDYIKESVGTITIGEQTLEQALTEVVQSDLYKSLPSGVTEESDQKALTKEKLIHKTYSNYYKYARDMAIYEHPEFVNVNGENMQDAIMRYEQSRNPFESQGEDNQVNYIINTLGVQ